LLAGVAVKVIFVLLGKVAVHVVGQLIPAGVLVTVPVPAAGEVTVNWDDGDDEPPPLLPLPQPARKRESSGHNKANPNVCKDRMARGRSEKHRNVR
jgi:hypothetical protein